MEAKEFISQIRPLRNQLFRLALLLGSKPDVAEDIVQETLTRYWVHKEQVQKPKAWCYQLVRRLLIDHWRSNGKMESEDMLPEQPEQSLDPFQMYVLKEEKQRILELIRELPEKQKHTFHLRDIEGMSYQEIADILDIPLAQVKVNLHRARTRIRTMLTKLHAYGNP